MEKEQLVIGVDIGGTKLKAGLVSSQGKVEQKIIASTRTQNTKVLLDQISQITERLIVEGGQILGIGLSPAGLVSFDQGMIYFCPHLPLRNIPLRDIVQEKFGLPTFLDNDANLAALAENHYGAARKASNFILLTIGTGIGGGIIIDGKLYRGTSGTAAEIGHMIIERDGPACDCGSYGCFESLASGKALEKMAKEVIPKNKESLIFKLAHQRSEKITGQIVTTAAKQRDKLALSLLETIGERLGVGFSSLINIFNPELIVVAGGLAEAGELILEPAQRVIQKYALERSLKDVKVVRAKLGIWAAVIGAAALVRQELEKT